MVKNKAIKDEGQMLAVDDSKAPVVEVTHTQAKKLIKREMTNKQKEHVQKLVEANKLKWEAKKKEKQAQAQQQQDEKEEKQTIIYVKPKRIYPPRKKTVKKVESKSDDEPDDETVAESVSSDGDYQIKKVHKKIEKKVQAIKQIDETLNKIQPVNKYMEMLKNRWGN
jgi:hypothetical protein